MLQALVSTASRLLNELNQSLFHDRLPGREVIAPTPTGPRKYKSLQRVVLGFDRAFWNFIAARKKASQKRCGASGREESCG